MVAEIKFTSQIHRLEHLMGIHYIEVPPAIVRKLGGKFNVRLICTVNLKTVFQCGIVALGEGKGYISINAKRLKELNLRESDKVSVIIKKDESEFGAEVPEELVEVLAQDPEGYKRFQNLVAGKQRFIIRHVSSVKNSQLRIDRAITIINNLKKLAPGKETFKGMLAK